MSAAHPDASRAAGRLKPLVQWARGHPAAVALIVVTLTGGLALIWSLNVAISQAERARMAEKEARAQAMVAEAEMTRGNAALAESRDRLEDTLSRSLLRPLGLKSGPILEGAELEALRELAGMSEDRIRLRFLDVGLASPDTAEPLGRRAEAVVRSAVGLDPKRREAALALVRARLQDGADPRIRVACALLGAALGETEPEFVRKATATLVEALEMAPDPSPLALALRTLGRNEPEARRRLPRAAKSLIARLSQDAAFPTVTGLLTALEALVDRLTPNEATAAGARIVEKMQKTPSVHILQRLTRTLMVLMERMAPAEATELAGVAGARLADQLGRRIAITEIEPLAGSLRAVSARMSLPDAVTAVGRVVEEMSKPGKAQEYGALAQTFEILAGVLDPRDAGLQARMVIARVLEQIGKPAAPFLFPSLPLAIEVLAKRLTRTEVEQAWGWVAEQLSLWSDSYQRVPLTRTLKALRERLTADEAGRLALPAAARLVERMKQTKAPNELSTLALAMAAVTDGLKQQEAVQPATVAAALLMAQVGKTSDVVLEGQLAGTLKALRLRLGPEPMRQPAAVAQANQLVERMVLSPDPVQVRVLAQGLAGLAGWVSPDEAKGIATRLVALMSRTSNPVALHFCALAMKALVSHLDAEAVRKLVAPATSRLLASMSQSLPAGGFEIVAGALGLLADRLDSKDATAAAGLIARKLDTLSDPPALAELALTLKPLLDRAAPAEARTLAFRATARVSDQLVAAVQDLTAIGQLAPALDRLAERLDLQGLVDLLKRPTCIGPAREAVLRLLERRGKRKFDDAWDLVAWLRKEHPAVDLRAAPARSN